MVKNQFRKVSASFRYDLEAKTRLLSFFKKKIVLENGNFHLLPQRVRANHLVFIKLKDQSYPMVYGIWCCGVLHIFCVKAEKVPNHC
jgi:hypothetical protein